MRTDWPVFVRILRDLLDDEGTWEPELKTPEDAIKFWTKVVQVRTEERS